MHSLLRLTRAFSLPRKPSGLRSVLLLPAGLFLIASPVHAALQTWLGDSANPGTGSWSTSADWSPNTWVAGNTAIFGNTAGTVTVGTQTASGLTFNVTGYTLQSGTLTLSAASSINATTGSTTISAVLAGTGGFSKDGAGTLTLSGSNTITGGITMNTGTLAINAGTGLGQAPGAPTVQLTFAGDSTFQIGNNNLVANRLLAISPGINATIDTGANTVSGVQGVISGAGSLVKAGTGGTLTLAGVNSYTGTTTVSAGTLLLSSTGSINASTAVNVNVGALTLNNAAALSDSGTLSLVSGTTLNLNAASGTSETIAKLVLNGTAEPAGTYTAAQLTTLAGTSGGITFASGSGETLTVTPVPEPASWIAAALVALTAVHTLRRRVRAG